MKNLGRLLLCTLILAIAAPQSFASAGHNPSQREADGCKEKKSKKKPKEKRDSDADNDSIRTQDETGDAMAHKVEKERANSTLEERLADVDARIEAEQARHANAAAGLQAQLDQSSNPKASKKVQKAIDKEAATHQMNLNALLAERERLQPQ